MRREGGIAKCPLSKYATETDKQTDRCDEAHYKTTFADGIYKTKEMKTKKNIT